MTASELPVSTILRLSTPLYCLCWWFIFVFHLVMASFALCASSVHLILSRHDAHVNNGGLNITIPIKRMAGVSYMVLTLLHLTALWSMLIDSFRSKRLTLQVVRSTAITSSTAPTSKVHHVYEWLHGAWTAVFSSTGYLGINGSFFNTALVAREFVEVALQSYQLWALSHSVSRPWISTFAVVAVAVNCWSLPIGNLLFKKSEGRRRLTHLVMDMYLDFACAVVVPICILVPYLLQYDWVKNTFPPADDAWYVNAVAEARYVLVTSYVDFCSSLLPQYSIFSCIRLIKKLVHRAPRSTLHRHALFPVSPIRRASTVLRSKPSLRRISTELTFAVGEQSSIALGNGSRSLRLTTASMALWGIFIVYAHVKAQASATLDVSEGCLLSMKPWFATNTTCAVLNVNCYRRGMNGSEDEISTVVAGLERDVLTRVIFSHCPALVFPRILQQFSGLNWLIIAHSNLTSWSRDAAITQSTNPSLLSVQIGNTIMNEIPEGLYHSDLPHSLIVIGISNCSLSAIPEDIGNVWETTNLQQIRLESNLIRTIPASLRLIPLKKLWITGNLIKELPEDLFDTSALFSIRVSGNPLKRLPSKMGDASVLGELFVEYTNVATLPPWVVSWLDTQSQSGDRRVSSFYRSPLCGGDLQGNHSWHLCRDDFKSRDGLYSYAFLQATYPQ